VLGGLSRLTGACVAVYVTMRGMSPKAPPEVRDYLDHGWTADERSRVLAYYAAMPVTRDPMIGTMLRTLEEPTTITMRRADLVANNAWYASRLHNELHRPGGLDDVLLSIRFHGDASQTASGLVFKREAGDKPFTEEEREILNLFRSESDWIFQRERDASPYAVEGLTRREQETLALLLTDASEKMMAAQLGISPHTVHDYVKRLYRKIGVTSRAALMAQTSTAPRRRTLAPA
jgi:DNA-binding CsgD family transcriptional regulator